MALKWFYSLLVATAVSQVRFFSLLVLRFLPLAFMLSGPTYAYTLFSFEGTISRNDTDLPVDVGDLFTGTLIYTPELAIPYAPGGTSDCYHGIFEYFIQFEGYSVSGNTDYECLSGASIDIDPFVTPSTGPYFPDELWLYGLNDSLLEGEDVMLAALQMAKWDIYFIDNNYEGKYLDGLIGNAEVIVSGSEPMTLALLGFGLCCVAIIRYKAKF